MSLRTSSGMRECVDAEDFDRTRTSARAGRGEDSDEGVDFAGAVCAD